METFSMGRKEVPRAGLLKAALAGRITNAQGARALSVRQFRRLKKRFREGGARGLLHALRGRPGNQHLAPPAQAQIATLMTTTCAGFNDVHPTEKLREVHELVVSRPEGPGHLQARPHTLPSTSIVSRASPSRSTASMTSALLRSTSGWSVAA